MTAAIIIGIANAVLIPLAVVSTYRAIRRARC